MITFIEADDWVGMYRDGELVTQGHSLDMFWVLRNLDVEFQRFEAFEVIEELGECPEELPEGDAMDLVEEHITS
jgi:hypothetical protein